MSGFAWTDRHGVQHMLTSGTPLVAERAAIEAELAALAPAFEQDDIAARDEARAKAIPLLDRHDQLIADGDRWNAHAEQLLRPFAAQTISTLDDAIAGLGPIATLVAMHDEHHALERRIAEKTAEAGELERAPTALQGRVIGWVVDVSGIAPPETGTRRAAYTWIQSQPLAARAVTGEAGWFAWTDKHGVDRQIADPLPIERELAEARRVMAILARHLSPETDLAAVAMALEGTAATFERCSILRYDLERFDAEADARDAIECAAFAARLKELGS